PRTTRSMLTSAFCTRLPVPRISENGEISTGMTVSSFGRKKGLLTIIAATSHPMMRRMGNTSPRRRVIVPDYNDTQSSSNFHFGDGNSAVLQGVPEHDVLDGALARCCNHQRFSGIRAFFCPCGKTLPILYGCAFCDDKAASQVVDRVRNGDRGS